MLDSQANRATLPAADGAAGARRPDAGGATPRADQISAQPLHPRVDWHGLDPGRIRALVDAVPEAVLVTEPDGELRFTNRAADLLFADQPVVDRADLLSRFEPIGVERPEALSAADRAEARDEAVIVRQRSRPTRWFSLRTVPLGGPHEEPATATDAAAGHTPADGAPGAGSSAATDTTVAFVLRDVTDSRDLRPVREAFIGLVSHELRTPITTIYAGSSVLARQASLTPPVTRTLARDVSTEAARLYDLVEDLLVLARIERGVLQPLDEPVLVERVVDSTIRVALERHGDAAIRRRPSAGAVVRGDSTYIDQAVRNLVLAVVRRPRQAAEPDLEIEVRSKDAAATVEVVIRDRGPAVSDTELGHVFDLPDATAGRHQSIGGLGLFVARQVVEAMGGRTWASNRPDGGLELGMALRVDDAA